MSIPILCAQAIVSNTTAKNSSTFFQDRIGTYVAERLWLLDFKTRNSKYEQWASDLNTELTKWLKQFPPEAQLGCLLLASSLHYFTEDEFSRLISDVAKELNSATENQPSGGSYFLPLTDHTEIHPRLARKTLLREATPNSDNPNTSAEAFVSNYANAILEQTQGAESIYFSISSMVNRATECDYVVCEDWSLSGNTLCSTIERLYKLMDLVYSGPKTTASLRESGLRRPKIQGCLLIQTDQAKDRIHNSLGRLNQNHFITNTPVISAYTVPATFALTSKSLPDSLDPLRKEIGEEIIQDIIATSLDIFSNLHADSITQHFSYLPPEKRNSAIRFGFGSGGWTLVSSRNCPNNTLPIVWWQSSTFSPLFGRAESHHSSIASETDSIITEIEKSRDRLDELAAESVRSITKTS